MSFDERRATKRRAARAEARSGALAYQWLRGSEEIAGATASTHVLTVADVGARLSVRVESGDGSITNAATAPVWPAPAHWSLKPADIAEGERFRRVFVTSGRSAADSGSIGTYDAFVQNHATGGHADIRPYGSRFKVIGSTRSIAARDHTGSSPLPGEGGPGVAIPHVGMSRGDDGHTLRLGNRLRFGSTSEVSVEGEFPEDGRTMRLGYRYGFGRSFDLSVEAVRRASDAGDGAPEHGLWLRGSLWW